MAKQLRVSGGLLAEARRTPHLADLLDTVDFRQNRPTTLCDAHTAVLASFVGERWLSAGDAAMSLDPISSQGLFNGMYSGFLAGSAIERAATGDAAALPAYAAGLGEIWQRYECHLANCYRSERRWLDEPFWKRRGVALAHRS